MIRSLPVPASFLLLAACGLPSAPSIVVSDAWARATAPGQEMGAAYVMIENKGGAPDRLVGATSSRAKAMIHGNVAHDGVARMRPVEALGIPAGAKVRLQPGGTHIMLEGLSAPLVPGESFDLRLRFDRSGEQVVPVTVVAAGAR